MEDVNKPQQNFLSPLVLEIQLQEPSPTFGKKLSSNNRNEDFLF